MSEEKNYITPSGYGRLQEEFEKLKFRERPELVEVISWAASNGDRSENGDYIYGKKRLREIDKKLRYLTRQINTAEIIDPSKIESERIEFGATVRILDDEGAEKEYSIVGTDESDPERGKISWKSPIAKALYNKEAGDFVTYHTPRGERDLEILEVKYVPVPV